MTREEINKFLANTKVYVAGKSEELQKKLFSLGYKWDGGWTGVEHTESPFLFIYTDMSFFWSNDMRYFSDHRNKEISAEEILSLELTEPSLKEKFDPKTLQPFDRVLMFDTIDKVWRCDLYSHKVNEQDCFNPVNSYRSIGDATDKVIPYNEETKHLVGTSNDTPEFYRYWEE